MQAIPKIKEFFNNDIVRDLIKIAAINILLRALFAILLYAYVQISLEELYTDMKMDISLIEATNPSSTVDSIKKYEDLMLITKLSSVMIMPLSLFYVFFKIPPKTMRHISWCTMLLVTISLLLSGGGKVTAQEVFIDNVMLVCFVLLPWLCSLAIFRMKKHHPKHKNPVPIADNT